MASETTPRLARAIWLYVSMAPRKFDSVVDWAKRQGWAASEALDTVSWLDASGLVESYERTAEEWLRVAPGAGEPEGEEHPKADAKVAAPKPRKASRKVDDESIERDEEGDDESSEGEVEESEDDDQDDEDEPASEPEPTPAPPSVKVTRVPSPGAADAASWQEQLLAYLAAPHGRNRSSLGQWANGRALPFARVQAHLDELLAAGRVTKTGNKFQPVYKLAEAGLAKAEKPEAKAARKAAKAEAPAPASEPEAITVARVGGTWAVQRSSSDLLADLVALPSAERAAVLERVERVSRLAAHVEELERQLVDAKATLAAALRGDTVYEAPVVEAPAVGETPVVVETEETEAPKAKRAPRRQPKPATMPSGSLDERILHVLAGGQMSATGVHAQLGGKLQSIYARLSMLSQVGRLVRVGKGVYALAAKSKRGAA